MENRMEYFNPMSLCTNYEVYEEARKRAQQEYMERTGILHKWGSLLIDSVNDKLWAVRDPEKNIAYVNPNFSSTEAPKLLPCREKKLNLKQADLYRSFPRSVLRSFSLFFNLRGA